MKHYLILIIFLAAISGNSAQFILVLHLDGTSIRSMLANESAKIREYDIPRHLTLMWLRDIDKNQPAFKSLAKKLQDIAEDFVAQQTKEQGSPYVVAVDQVIAFPGGGIHLEPTKTAKAAIKSLYNRLRIAITEAGFDGKIDWHLRHFSPHVTLVKAQQTHQFFQHPAIRNAFLQRMNRALHRMMTGKTAKLLALPLRQVSSWIRD